MTGDIWTQSHEHSRERGTRVLDLQVKEGSAGDPQKLAGRLGAGSSSASEGANPVHTLLSGSQPSAL
jgi:hypothetical protein